MSDLISRQAAIDAINSHFEFNIEEEYGSAVQEVINGLPSAEPVKHGRWTGINRNRYNDDEATCSICGATFASGYSDPSWWDYCPNCGAKMDEEAEA